MTMRYTKQPSQRQLRVGEFMRGEIASLLSRGILINYGLEDAIISVSEVRISPDLKIATAFLSVAIEEDKPRVIAILEPLSIEVRRMIAPKLGLRFIPQLRLVFDEVANEAARIDKLLRDWK